MKMNMDNIMGNDTQKYEANVTEKLSSETLNTLTNDFN